MTKEVKKFAVIGGQYEFYFYGFCDTLEGAKRLASRNIEYWDNWQGWNYPRIYRAEDVVEVENFYGVTYAPNPGCEPVASRVYGDKWVVDPM